MKIRCPHCDTLYDIDETTLASVDYTAVCCQCHRVFSAEKLSTPEEPETISPVTDVVESPLAHTDGAASTEVESNHTQPTQTEEDEWDFVHQEQSRKADRPAPSMATEIPDDFSSLAAAELPEYHFSKPKQTRNRPSFILITAILLAALLAAAQLGWINKQRLLEQPQGRQLMQRFCDLTGCELEQKTALDKFTVLHRDLQPAVSHGHALNFTLSFTNSAEFSQQLPRLQLSLLDANDRLHAQRTFTPDEYLYPASGDNRNMKPKEIINLELLLQDEGLDTSSFELEFL